MDYQTRYEQWVTSDYFDEETKKELLGIQGNAKEIEERFYKDLEFGTGGLRGIIGAGTNRMNPYTIGKATQGLANYIKKQGRTQEGVVIAYDCRNMSPEFAKCAALVLCANQIPAYLFDELRPTPELSFAVRKLKAAAGIVITASHNPKEYNGYKVYWEDGGQAPYPRDEAIMDEVNAVKIEEVQRMEEEEAAGAGLLHIVGKEIDDDFIEKVKSLSLHPECIQEVADTLTVVYTPFNGTGSKPVRRVLSEMGFRKVYIVPEQEHPDGNFTTVGYPNPEDPKAFRLALELAKEKNADLVIATDPDADRVGVAVKDADGSYVHLTGNMSGVLLTEYVLSQRKAAGKLPENSAVVKTIVSTEMIRPIAEDYHVALYDVLTGFKYIGEKIKEFEESGNHTYAFGFEESYGSLAGDYARDKDAVAAAMLICEMAAYYKIQKLSLIDALQNLYKKYGYYQEGVRAVTLEGLDGVKKMQSIMDSLRKNGLKEFAGKTVAWVRDYQTKKFVNLLTGETEEDTLPKSNVLHYTFEDGGWMCVRPSGTEPKIKFYYGVKCKNVDEAAQQGVLLEQAVDEMVNAI